MDQETSGQISYIRLTDTLSSAGRNDLVERIKDKDWTVFDELYNVYPKLTSTGDKSLEEDTRNLAHHDIYNLAKFTYRIVPEDRNDIPRIVRMIISSIEIPQDKPGQKQIEVELLGLAEISKFSQSSSIMDVDMAKITAIDWTQKSYKYPIEFCMDVLYSNAEEMMGQMTQLIKSIDIDAMLAHLPSESDSDSE